MLPRSDGWHRGYRQFSCGFLGRPSLQRFSHLSVDRRRAVLHRPHHVRPGPVAAVDVRVDRRISIEAEGGISAFQAFCVGLASRVGTGNIAGVAIAITLGGPGAIFWMWLVAVVGMATAFVEATLAQMYKVRNPDGGFRGGPALGKWAFGALADFEAMRREGRDDKFVGRGNSHLPGDLPGDVWDPVLDNDPTMN